MVVAASGRGVGSSCYILRDVAGFADGLHRGRGGGSEDGAAAGSDDDICPGPAVFQALMGDRLEFESNLLRWYDWPGVCLKVTLY